MDGFRELQEKADEQRRLLTRNDNFLVATRLDKAERPEGFDAERYSVESVRMRISTVDQLLGLPQSRLRLTDMDRYQIRLHQTRWQSHVLVNDKKFTGDSSRMTLVKNALTELESYLAAPGITLDAETLTTTEGLYDTALARCQEYIDNKNPWFSKGKERLRMIKEAKVRLEEEKLQLAEAKKLLEANSNVFAGLTCVRDVLLKGQAALNKVKPAGDAPENLTWDDYASMATGKLKGSITYSGKGLREAASDSETAENRRIKERLFELVKTRVRSDAMTKDFELRIRSRLGIDNNAFESAPLSRTVLKEIYDMIAEEASLVTNILSRKEPAEAENPEDNSPAVQYALAKAVDRYIGTRKEAAASSKTVEEGLKNTRDEFRSLMNKAESYGTAVQPLTDDQLNNVALSDMGKLRDTVFAQLEDVYDMTVVISGGDHSLYKDVAGNEELVVRIASLIITKAATQNDVWKNLVTDTELILLKQQMAFDLATKKKEDAKPEENAASPAEKLKDGFTKMSELRELSSFGSEGFDELVNRDEELKNADKTLKSGLDALKKLAAELKQLGDFEKSTLQNGAATGALAFMNNLGNQSRAKIIKGLFYNAKGEVDLQKVSAMEQAAGKLKGTRFAAGFEAARKLFVDEKFDLLEYVNGLIGGCKKSSYKRAVFQKPEAFKDKTTEEQDKLLLGFDKQDQLVLSAFMMRDDFSKIISSKKDKTAKEIAHVKDVLRTFRSGEVHAADVSIGATSFTLVQKENNDLYIIKDHKQVPLSFGAAFIASRIEQSITQNDNLYGKDVRNNVLKDAAKVYASDDVLTLRSLYINVLSREAKCTTEELSHISLNDLKSYSNALLDGSMTGEAIKNEVKSRYTPALINGAEALDIMSMIDNVSDNELKSMVVYSEEQKQKIVEEQKQKSRDELIVEKPWTKEELEVKNFITDLIYLEDTWQADASVTKPGMRIYEAIRKNSKAVANLLVKNDLLDNVLAKLPLPGETVDSIGKTDSQVAMKLEIKDAFESFKNSGFIAECMKKCKGKVTADALSGALSGLLRVMSYEKIEEIFDPIEKSIDEVVVKAVDSIQETTVSLAKEMFGDAEYRYQEQPKRMFQALLTDSSIFDNTDDLAAMKTALCSILKKHSGGLVQCMHKPGLIEDYLNEVPEPEKKEDRNKFKDAKDVIKDAINDLVRKLKQSSENGLKDFVYREQPEDKEHNIRANHEARLKFESLMDNPPDELINEFSQAMQGVAIYLREEIKDPKEKDITPEEKQSRVEAGGRKLNRIIEQNVSGDKGQGRFIKLIFSNYFKDVSIQEKRSMLASALRGAKSLTLADSYADKNVKQSALDSAIAKNYIGGFLKGAGPLLQKILQGMPTAMLPPELKGAVEDMKSNLSPIPEKIVQAQMVAIVKGSKGKIQKIQIDRSLGAASVGQAFLCRLFGPGLPETGKEVVIKLLRPDVRNRMLREKSVMLDCAAKTDENNGMKDTYEGMLERIEEELDLTIEASNVKKGEIYNSEDKKVETMKLSDIIAPSPTVMVMERAPGITLDQYIRDTEKEIDELFNPYIQKNKSYEPLIDHWGAYELGVNVGNMSKVLADREALAKKLEELKKRQSYLIEMSKKWVQEGVFGKGFYHGDLHSGNIMISDEKVTVIDFGNATTLTSDQQTQIIRMISAAAVGDWEGFRSGYHALLPKDREEIYQRNKDRLGLAFKEVFELGDFKYSGQRIGAALLRAQEMGLQLPAAIQNFSQCQLRLQNAVDELNGQIEKIQRNISKFDNATAQKVDVNPELLLRDQYKSYGSYLSNSKLEKEIRRVTIPGEEEYKDFSKLLEGSSEEEITLFENKYVSDYSDMKNMASDAEFLQQFFDFAKQVKVEKEIKKLIEGEKKDDFEKCLRIIQKHSIPIKEYDFRSACLSPYSYYAGNIKNALDRFKSKADALEEAGLTDTYKTLLDEYRTLQKDPESKPEDLETKRKALFEEYKKVHEIYFTKAGALSSAVDILIVMDKYKWKDDTSGIRKELNPLFEDKECKGEELRSCYDNYVAKIRTLEAEREKEEEEARSKVEDRREKTRIRITRKDDDECIRLRNEFLTAYRETTMLRLKKMQGYNKDYGHLNNQSAPDNFLDVMGEVIRDNLTSAIYKLGKYAFKYRKELTAQMGA